MERTLCRIAIVFKIRYYTVFTCKFFTSIRIRITHGNGVIMQAKSPSYLQSSLPFIVVSLSTGFYLYQFFLRVIPTIITHELQQAYSIDAGSLGLLFACFFCTYAAVQIPAGLLCDKYGPKACLVVSVFICAVSTFIMYFTNIFYFACLSRLLIGAVSACAFVAPLTLASRWYPPEKQALITGMVQLTGCLGAYLAGSPATYLINYLGWRDTFLLSAVGGFALCSLFALILQDFPADYTVTDKSSATSGSSGVIQRLYSVISLPQNWAIGLCAFGSWAPVTVFAESFGVPYLCALQNVSKAYASWQISWVWIAMAISSPLAGWVSNKMQQRKLPIFVLLVIGLISSVILVLCPPKHSPMLICALLFAIGVASSAQPITFGLIHDNNQPDVIATAMSFNNMMLISSACILQPFVGTLLTYLESTMGVANSLQAFTYAFMITPITVFISMFILHFFVRETFCKPISEEEQDVSEAVAV